MIIKKNHLRDARDQFIRAQQSLVAAARALQLSGLPCERTQDEIKATIGDLAITIATLDEQSGLPDSGGKPQTPV